MHMGYRDRTKVPYQKLDNAWNEYKDKKDDAGVSFKTCVFSGVKNLDSGIGLYAGDHSSYRVFNKLFDKVI